ncbi:MAG: response regulator [Bryobacteraceae bacterium]
MSLSVEARHRFEAGVGAAPDPGRLTILVAEDEPAIRAAIGQLLKKQGYRVLEAADGVEALAVAARHPGPIHLLLTDLRMPRLDGHELHRRMNHQRPETRTLFMSASPDTGLHPAAAFLPKPFAPRVLVRKVNELLRPPAR